MDKIFLKFVVVVLLIGSLPTKVSAFPFSYKCPKLVADLVLKARRSIERPSQLREAALRPLFFSESDPKRAFLNFLDLAQKSRSDAENSAILSKDEYQRLTQFVDETLEAFWDPRVSEVIYRLPANEVTFLRAFQVIHQAYSLRFSETLIDPSARRLSRGASLSTRTSRQLLDIGYIAFIGTIIYGLAAGVGSPISDFIIARGKQIAFHTSNFIYPPSPNSDHRPDHRDTASVQASAIEHYRQLMSIYSTTEQVSLGRATWYETSLLILDSRLAEYQKNNDKKQMQALFVVLVDWERRFQDLHQTELGAPVMILLQNMFSTYDRDGSFRLEANRILKEVAEAK